MLMFTFNDLMYIPEGKEITGCSIFKQVWLIDVSQSVEPTHPHGLEFLFRDCRNVSQVGM